MVAHILATRALNAVRTLHLPTYVGLRLLVESICGQQESAWIQQVLPRKYPTRTVARMLRTQRFKRLEADGTLSYRDIHVPSPTTSLTEALVLRALSHSTAFQKPGCVFSYRWPPSDDYPRSFEHY